MVKLEEVQDEAFAQSQDDEGDWDTDSAASDVSSIVSDDDVGAVDETLAERLAALVDIIPPTQRRRLGANLNTTYEWGSWGLSGGLKIGWQVCVSALLLVVPFGLAMMEDQMMQMEERQLDAARRENEIMTPGATSAPPPGQVAQPL